MSRPLFDALVEVGAQIIKSDHVLLCSDFDGTLAQFVDHPNLAGLSLKVREVLCRLNQFDRLTLAVMSGREVTDLQDRVGIPGLIIAGNHGLEISGPGFFFVEPAAAQWSSELKVLARELKQQLRLMEGVLVEDKDLTLSVHYRMAAKENWQALNQTVHRVLAEESAPFVLTEGDRILEIRPPIRWNTSSAVNWLQDQLSRQYAQLVFVGEDSDDEAVFSAFPKGITVKVGEGSDTSARYTVDDPEEVYAFLEWIVELLNTEKELHELAAKVPC